MEVPFYFFIVVGTGLNSKQSPSGFYFPAQDTDGVFVLESVDIIHPLYEEIIGAILGKNKARWQSIFVHFPLSTHNFSPKYKTDSVCRKKTEHTKVIIEM